MNRVGAPTEAEIKQAAETLAKLEPGFLPRAIFDQVARLAVMSIIELVPVRTRAGRTEVLLDRRAPDDTNWPNQWCNAGCVIRPSDEPHTYKDAFRRLFEEDLGGAQMAGLPVYVRTIHNFIDRGFNNAMIYWVELTGETPRGQWFDSRKLPEHTMKVQRQVIADAVAHYERVRHETLG